MFINACSSLEWAKFFLGDKTMDTKELKKILAGVGVVGLLAGGGIAVPGSAGASG